MKRETLLLVIIIFSSYCYSSNNSILKGVININENDSYNITLQYQDTTKILSVAYIKHDFEIDAPKGMSLIVIKSPHYEDFQKKVNIIDSITDLGIITLIPKRNIDLNEVTVTAKKMKITRSGMDYTINNLQGTLLAEAGNLLDMLKWTPGVIVGGDNSISVIGRNEAKVYIDDRIVNDKAQLMGLQSSQVSKIQVIRNPDAQYASETSAVIKIYTKRNIQDYFAVTINNKTEINRKLKNNSGITLSGKKGKISSNLSFNYRRGNSINYKDEEVEIKHSETDVYKDVSNSKIDSKSNVYNIYGGINYNISSKNLLILQYSGSILNHPKFQLSTTHNIQSNDIEQLKNEVEDDAKYDDKTNTVTAGYTLNRNQFSTLNLTASFQSKNNNRERNLRKEYYSGHPDYTTINSSNKYNIYTFDGNYSFKIKNNDSERIGMSMGQINHNSNVETNNALQYSKRNDSWLAAYVSSSYQITKKLSSTLGLRYEYNKYDYKGYDLENAKDSRSSFLPNVNLAYKLSDNNTYAFVYARSIGYPTIQQMNSVVTYVDATHCITGNPNLKPVEGDRFGLSANFGDFSTELSFYHWNKKIINALEQSNDSELITYKTINSDYLNSFSWEVDYVINDENDKFYFDIYCGLNYNQLKYHTNDNIVLKNQISMFLSGDAYWNINKIFKCYANFYYHTPWMIGDLNSGYQLDVNVGIAAVFYKRKIRIALEGNDLFARQTAPTYYERNYLNVNEKVYNKYDSRGISLSFRYSFDSHKIRFKQADSNSSTTTTNRAD